jgi:hypothetical protein
LDWLKIGTGGELFCMRWWTFGFLRHGVSLAKYVMWSVTSRCREWYNRLITKVHAGRSLRTYVAKQVVFPRVEIKVQNCRMTWTSVLY